ncbi:MAG: hypothetical protein AAFO69_19845, partial [Bacteroidota bacterium]
FWLLRFPIDLFYHSQSVEVSKLSILPSIGSDHLPLMAECHITASSEPPGKLQAGLKEVLQETVAEGKAAAKVENS